MASFTVRAIVVAGGVGLLVFLGAGPAQSSLISKNLLVNGNAELGAAATDTKTVVKPQAWKTVGSFTSVSYGVAGMPGLQTSANIGGGKHFFAGGPTTAPASASQSVPVPASWRKAVASGRTFAQLSANLGGSQMKPDAAVVIVQFLDVKGKPLGGFKIGPVTPAQRGETTGLVPEQAVHSVARACRSVRVTIASPGGTGVYDDAYADNVALRLLQ